MSPQFTSLEAFADMGGHGPFVWGAWGLSALVIIGLVVATIQAQRHWERRLAELEILSAQAKSQGRVERP